MGQWAKYRSRRAVEAAPIVAIVEHGGVLSILVKPYGDDTVERFVPNRSTALAHAKVGHFAVRYGDGFRAVLAPDFLARDYEQTDKAVPG